TCFYDATRRDGSSLEAAISFDANGEATKVKAPPKATMKRSLWAVKRQTRADPGYKPHQVKPMLDAPFYNRAMVRTKLDGQETTGVYEALNLRRYRGPWLMPMIALRVPRRRNWRF
ncbi:MAG: carotenoid 1,2-hydratase, partial [Pseudomonadota bacterium]